MNTIGYINKLRKTISGFDHEFNSRDYDDLIRSLYRQIIPEISKSYDIHSEFLTYEYLKAIVDHSLEENKRKPIQDKFEIILNNFEKLLKYKDKTVTSDSTKHKLGPFDLRRTDRVSESRTRYFYNDFRIRFRVV